MCFSTTVLANTKVKLGMSNATAGPVASLGAELYLGSQTYFEQLNLQGGINGKQVELLSLNDNYEPKLTVINTRTFIEQEQIFALFGYVGTPTSYAIFPILKKTGIPYLMPFTGADFLRRPIQENIFNLRASYLQEAQTQIDYLINKKRYKNIALVIQADEFGLAAQRALNKELSRYNITPVVNARYQRNTRDMSHVIKKLQTKPIDAVIFIGTYEPFSHLINTAAQEKIDVLFTSLSFIASHEVYSRLKYNSRVMITEVFPDPSECRWTICQRFKNDMTKAGVNKLNRVQLEGYINAHVFSEVAKRCEQELSHACLIKQFEQYSFKDKDLDIKFSDNNHQGLQKIYLSFSPGALLP
ncbi:ABC transporter substrate-binding protein [Colwellia asteriadis]